MYVSYALAIPLIALLTLIEYLIVPDWSLFRLVVLATLICLPLIPWIWQYSRVIWIYFDRYFDPETTSQDEHRRSRPDDEPIDEGNARACRKHDGNQAALRPIAEVARDLGIDAEHLEPYGRDKAKVRLEALQPAEATRPPGKLILVSAITPTPAGEGKTTTSIGLAQGLRRIGKHAALALRQPSMGPVFGRKGGATGGGASRRRAVEHDQPPVHRRLPRDHRRAQPARRRDRQPAPLRRHRPRPDAASSGSAPST